MKRVSVNFQSQQPSSGGAVVVDKQALNKIKHETLLKDYLKLQKGFVSAKKKLQIEEEKRINLLAEVQYGYLTGPQSSTFGPKYDVQQPDIDAQTEAPVKRRKCRFNEAASVDAFPSVYRERQKQVDLGREKTQTVDLLPLDLEKSKKCIVSNRRVGKKRISWQSSVDLKV
ncbi:hypothetical protein RJ641_006242 [Dillenia turbinata]|uniref:Uncharacterized protein n=1 Tax=Dillenia turbinata TaxID=194707 RepID=A0AAN8VCT8_9MAGN